MSIKDFYYTAKDAIKVKKQNADGKFVPSIPTGPRNGVIGRDKFLKPLLKKLEDFELKSDSPPLGLPTEVMRRHSQAGSNNRHQVLCLLRYSNEEFAALDGSKQKLCRQTSVSC